MTTVYTGASMSIDGFIAGLEDSGSEDLFAWYNNGDVAVPTANPDIRLSSGWSRTGSTGHAGWVCWSARMWSRLDSEHG